MLVGYSKEKVSIIVGELFWLFEQLMLDCLIHLHVVLPLFLVIFGDD
jgi:hypothetical protein